MLRARFESDWLRIGLVAALVACGSSSSPEPELVDSGVEPVQPIELVLVAGDGNGVGSVDGTGAAARFYSPSGIAVDANHDLYVADRDNHTIRKITAAGVVTTLAGAAGMPGHIDGVGAAARFDQPSGVAVDSSANVYVADLGSHTIRKITASGDVSTLAGSAGMTGSADGAGAVARFKSPSGVAVDSEGNVYVADRSNATIRKITAAGDVTTLAGTAGMGDIVDGTGAAARFYGPARVGLGLDGNLYVTGAGPVRKVTLGGQVTTIAIDGVVLPTAVASDSTGNLYVVDVSTVRKRDVAGTVTTLAGTAGAEGSADGTGAAARFHGLTGVALGDDGTLFVADQLNHAIRAVAMSGAVTTLAGTASLSGSVEGKGAAARFNVTGGVAANRDGTIYVVDTLNNAVRKITTTGVVTTLAGVAGLRGSADGTGPVARFDYPFGAAIDSAGNLYIADLLNSTIRKVTASGVVTTLAGTAGMSGSADGIGAAARFASPSSVAVDRAGNLYVTDLTNANLRKITPEGVVSTLAGSAGLTGSADGTGAAARFDQPVGVAVDGDGNVYVADYGNHTLRKVTASGVVTTLAGSAGMPGSADGPGSAARFRHPVGIAVNDAGMLFVLDLDNATVRKLTPSGDTTIAGTPGVRGIAVGATPRFAAPQALAISGDSLVITDANAVLLLRHGAR